MKLFIFVYFASLLGNVGTVTWSSTVPEVLLFLLFSVHPSSAANPILEYKTTCTIVPEGCSTTAELDGERFEYSDEEGILKTKYMIYDESKYCMHEKHRLQGEHGDLKYLLNRLVELLNHARGNPTLRRVARCELVDGTCGGFIQFYYDGEKLASLDLKTKNWTTATPQAEIFREEIDPRGDEAEHWKKRLKVEYESLKQCLSSRRQTPERQVTHSLQYQHTAVTPGINLPEFTAVGLVDGEQFVIYDTNIKEAIPKTAWIQKISADDPDYWKRETERMQDEGDRLTVRLGLIMVRFNQTQGVHTLQRTYSCELDDDGTTRGYDLYSYDGEDFMSLDLKTGTWTEAKLQAGIFIKEWDPTEVETKYWKSYLENDCIEWLKKFVSYSRETLERKVCPKVSLFHKHTPSPEVVCHATGFFPKALNITWQKDGEDVIEDVELNETLPNQDGTFQKRGILKVPAEELQKHTYTCVVQHSSLEKDLILEVAKDGGSGGGQIGVVIGVVVAVIALVAVVAAVVFWKKTNSGFKPVPPPNPPLKEILPPTTLKLWLCVFLLERESKT
ncbi:class I histocompatibility antigen, Gogo-B*0101 alpha chain-like isoform X2 [Neoarius graeffei]|uniref:class I histocompatibility antigen, Gogo-B*0101 alpha chain-like isoform X2 n=1 Tax=Neoarius graeffei TaxID=443677 RepID=UPI00298D16D7|nr:class I histocompatibility antigen, Gogo-B*0101 alpha chain-like isoform X2 [Neoarius graeffei]